MYHPTRAEGQIVTVVCAASAVLVLAAIGAQAIATGS